MKVTAGLVAWTLLFTTLAFGQEAGRTVVSKATTEAWSSDGIMVSDGGNIDGGSQLFSYNQTFGKNSIMVSDGIMVSDSIFGANSPLIAGDRGPSMQ